jgi:hypothetical protein
MTGVHQRTRPNIQYEKNWTHRIGRMVREPALQLTVMEVRLTVFSV